MRQTLDAIYENGAFKPLHPDQVHFADRRRVTLVVDDSPLPESLRLALGVYEGLSENEIDEIECIALDRTHFFDQAVVDE